MKKRVDLYDILTIVCYTLFVIVLTCVLTFQYTLNNQIISISNEHEAVVTINELEIEYYVE